MSVRESILDVRRASMQAEFPLAAPRDESLVLTQRLMRVADVRHAAVFRR